MNVLNLITSGGWMMVPIALASVVTLALILDHAWTHSRAKKHLAWLWTYPEKRDQLLTKKPTDPILHFLHEAEDAKPATLDATIELAADVLDLQERRISWLGTLAAIAPLLGLLGTVSGMIAIFFRIAGAPPANPLADLSHGISEALVATAGGLVVAIAAALGQHGLRNANDDLGMDLTAWLKRNQARAGDGGKTVAYPAK